MAWLGIEGHDQIAAQFRHALSHGRLASTFLFVGPEGIGKRAFAVRLAQSLLCEQRDSKLLDPCGECPGCRQVLAGSHPDLLQVSRPSGKSALPLGLLKGDEPEFPVRDSLIFNLSMRPFRGGRKVAIIDDADYLNLEGANCLLKTLEEPPPRSLLILIGTSADRQLPTIRSRAQIVRFRPLEEETMVKLLVAQQVVDSPSAAARLAEYSGGSLKEAHELADPELWTFREKLFRRLAEPILPSVTLAHEVLQFVDEAGKEAPPRRARLRIVLKFAIDFFSQLTRHLCGRPAATDSEATHAVEMALGAGVWNLDSIAAAAQRTLDALTHIDRNANQSTLVEAWCDDVLTQSRRQPV